METCKRCELPVAKHKGNILVLLLDAVTKTKSIKIVSMISTIHTNISVDSGKTNQETN